MSGRWTRCIHGMLVMVACQHFIRCSLPTSTFFTLPSLPQNADMDSWAGTYPASTARLLLGHMGTQPACPCADGKVPLHGVATWQVFDSSRRKLLEAVAERTPGGMNAADAEGCTLAHLLARQRRPNARLLKFVVEAGANLRWGWGCSCGGELDVHEACGGWMGF